jgi:hypothetical protein
MIRDRFNPVLIHYRLSPLVGSAGWNDPELGYLAGGATRTALDPIRINTLVVREVEL